MFKKDNWQPNHEQQVAAARLLLYCLRMTSALQRRMQSTKDLWSRRRTGSQITRGKWLPTGCWCTVPATTGTVCINNLTAATCSSLSRLPILLLKHGESFIDCNRVACADDIGQTSLPRFLSIICSTIEMLRFSSP